MGFDSGHLFEWRIDVGGVGIELLAEIETVGSTLHLRDVAIYPVATDRANVGAAALLRAARSTLFPAVKEAGFARMRITGHKALWIEPGA